jgi:protein ImuB
MFGAVYAVDEDAADVLIDVAREFSPRIEIDASFARASTGDRPPSTSKARQVVLDLGGLTRLFGDTRAMGEALRQTAAERGLRVQVAIAGTCTAARLLVRAASRPVTVVDPGAEAAVLARLPIQRLAVLAPVLTPTVAPSHAQSHASSHGAVLDTFRRWGLRTLGEVAALPAAAVAARLGQEGVRWQRLARGEDLRPLLPASSEECFEQALDLEWPIEGLEPLSFVHERSLQLPAPMRDARTLRTLALLDLESHPPTAAIDRVVVAIEPTPARVLQFSLLTRPLPSPAQISTLMARLGALMGEGRCGSPSTVDTWQPGAFAMKAFAPAAPESGQRASTPKHRVSVPLRAVKAERAAMQPVVALRRFRIPVPARVRVDHYTPVRLTTDRVAMRLDHRVQATRPFVAGRVPCARGLSGGDVQRCAGPWRTSGDWWTVPAKAWDRDEWDVTLTDGATYRVFRDRATDAWFIEGIVD